MINREHELPIKRQAELLNLSRGSVYYHPEPISEADLALMRRIDELHLEHPFAGSRMLRDMLRREGIEVGRRHVATLMHRMGIEALYRKPQREPSRVGRGPIPTSRIGRYPLAAGELEKQTSARALSGDAAGD